MTVNTEKQLVVLMHGIAQPRIIMSGLAEFMEDSGYAVLNLSYPSTDKTIDRLTGEIHKKLVHHDAFNAFDQIHFVTHSMGGLVARAYIERHRPPNLGRVVMMGPPNKGSEVADLLKDIWFYKAFFGPAGQELTTESRAPYGDHPVDFELGVIAGTSAVMSMFGPASVGPNDGLVTVESTKLPGMADHMTVPAAHVFIMNNPAARRGILSFLKDGHFPKLH